MTTLKFFNGQSSGCRTPDPLVLYDRSWAQKGSDSFIHDSVDDGSGSRTPCHNANVIIEALRGKLQELEAASLKCSKNVVVGPPPRSVKNCLGANTTKVVMNSNLAQPFSAVPSSLPPPPPHPGLRSIHQDGDVGTRAKPPKPLMKEQFGSNVSEDLPFYCTHAYKDVKRNGGCQAGANGPSCNYLSWSQAHAGTQPRQELCTRAGSEDARLEAALSLANKFASLLGDEETFASKPKENKMVKRELSVGSMGHLHSCTETCNYIRQCGGCMHGEACLNYHACLWKHCLSREALDYSRAGFSAAAQDVQGWEAGDGSSSSSSAAGFGTVAQDYQGSVDIPTQVSMPNELLKPETILSKTPVWGQSQNELAASQGSLKGFSWHVSVGSTGHPRSCGPACKFAMQSKGCKDGRLCSHCHLCRYVRRRGKKDRKQPIEITTAWMSV